MDIDAGTYWTEPAVHKEDDASSEVKDEISPVQSGLSFTKAKNSSGEATGGSISFLFLPDGTREFGVIIAADPETGESCTIFLNPYQSSPEIIEGEMDFNE